MSPVARHLKASQAVREQYLRIFVMECPDPIDAMQGRSEGPVISAIGRLIGHEVLTFLVRSKREFKETCKYIGSIDADHDSNDQTDRQLCLHISTHGNSNGLGIGADFLEWRQLATAIEPFLSGKMRHEGKRIVVLSACDADQKQLSDSIGAIVRQNTGLTAPEYLFCTSGEVEWQNAAVGWTLFYHLLPNVDLDQKKNVQAVLNKIRDVGVGRFVYFRWVGRSKRYVRYAGTERTPRK